MHCEIDLLRHGLTSAGHAFIGTTDAPLIKSGFEAMTESLARIKQDYDRIYSSPLSRCLSFAEDFAKRMSLPLSIKPGLAELYFGQWENKTSKQLHEQDPTALAAFWENPFTFQMPEGENLREFQHRVISQFTALAHCNRGKRILLVTHAGVIRMLLFYFNESKDKTLFDYEISHGSVTRLTVFCANHDADQKIILTNILVNNAHV